MRYRDFELERFESLERGNIAPDCDSLGEVGALELARDGGGLRSTDAFSLSGDVGGSSSSTGGSVGGTRVASDLMLTALPRASDWGDGTVLLVSSFPPVSSASSVISIKRRRRRELEEDVIEVEAV